MRFCEVNKLKLILQRFLLLLVIAILVYPIDKIEAQQKTATMRVGHFWASVTDNGYRGNATYTAGFFPNDYDIIGMNAQYLMANQASGFLIATKMFNNPYKTDPVLYPKGPVDTTAVYDLVNDFLKNGLIRTPLTSFMRYKYPTQKIVNPTSTQTVPLKTEDWGGVYDPSKFTGGTYDQIINVTNEYVYGITVNRKVLGWSQNFNDNYVIFDMEFTNNSTQTYDSLWIQSNCNLYSVELSNGRNPSPPTGEGFASRRTWQHYHGGRSSDTSMVFVGGKVKGNLRVFYEYSADDATTAGDNMGAPSVTQNGRLLGNNFHFYSILHASKSAYTNSADDQDDFLQPKVTYTGNPTKLPDPSVGDPYGGGKSFLLIKNGTYAFAKMAGNTFPGTRHSHNPDELGNVDYYNYIGAGPDNNMYTSFGPYKLAPGQKIHIVYANGWTGLDIKKAKEIGKKWLNGTLQEEPSNMPNANTGWLPSNFAFPSGATGIDKLKDRWLSSGIDSVMLASYRAKWNYDHKYQIPQAPPPPSIVTISAYGDGTEISWSAPEAEALPNFAGYRIMRRVSNADTTFYEVIYDSDKNDKGASHTYKDIGVMALAQYYYYMQTKALISLTDVNADPTTRGKIIYSSRLLFPNIYWVNPPRLSQNDLSKIRIAPNPYNINDPLLRTFGYTDQRAINFYNLPASCGIQIFTENGDLIKSITHESTVRAGSETWDMITDSQQVISSGVYIAVIKNASGEQTFLKFVVVR